MNQELREKAGIIYNVVETVVLAFAVSLTAWCANRVVSHGELISSHSSQIQDNKSRIDNMDTKGSRGLDVQKVATDELTKRIEKLESAVLALQAAPGELKAINIRLDGIVEGQKRIEKALEEHLKLSIKQ